jgi:hypothetical protein
METRFAKGYILFMTGLGLLVVGMGIKRQDGAVSELTRLKLLSDTALATCGRGLSPSPW